MRANYRKIESQFFVESARPARLATAKLQLAVLRAHSHPAAGPSDTCLESLAIRVFDCCTNERLNVFCVKSLSQNRRNIIQLNCVPRHAKKPS